MAEDNKVKTRREPDGIFDELGDDNPELDAQEEEFSARGVHTEFDCNHCRATVAVVVPWHTVSDLLGITLETGNRVNLKVVCPKCRERYRENGLPDEGQRGAKAFATSKIPIPVDSLARWVRSRPTRS